MIMGEKAQKGTSILSLSMFVLVLTHFLTHCTQRIHSVLFPIWRKPEELNLTLKQMGVIASLPSLLSTLLSIPVGLLSDKIGAKKMMLMSMSVLATAVALASQANSAAMIIVAVSLISLNSTIYHPPSYSLNSKLFPPEDIPKAMGIHAVGGTLGMSIGPISVGILMGTLAFGWRQVYLFWLIPIVLGIISVILLKEEYLRERSTEERVEEKESGVKEGARLLSLSLIIFLAFIGIRWLGQGLISTFMSIYLVDALKLSENLAAIVIGSVPLMGIFATPLGGFLAAKFGEKRWILTAYATAYTFFSLAVLVPHSLIFVAFYLAYGFFNIAGMPANSALIAKLSSAERRGLSYSLFFLSGNLLGSFSPILAAYLAESFGLYGNFVIGLVVLFSSLLLFKFGVKVD
ncbi:MAG: hypothetical protein DRO00_03670 [Thermoproteota archaeon]|nr:MAG: hypothetical protein DRO00_03670 [Candidatus Korarchaeota archaeon]